VAPLLDDRTLMTRNRTPLLGIGKSGPDLNVNVRRDTVRLASVVALDSQHWQTQYASIHPH